MTTIETYIQSYFKIPESDVANVAKLFDEETLLKGEFYVREGTYCQKMSFQTLSLIHI